MPKRALHFCNHPGCPSLTTDRYCPEHTADKLEARREQDKRRGSASSRGYDWRWQKYSTAFLRRPGNQICRLHIDEGCTLLADCVDHIDPPNGPSDPRFWDKANHQPACIHCNSVKGHRNIVGEYDF